MINQLNGSPGIHPAVRVRVLKAFNALADALDQSAANPSPVAMDNLREAADEAMRAAARVSLELRGH